MVVSVMPASRATCAPTSTSVLVTCVLTMLGARTISEVMNVAVKTVTTVTVHSASKVNVPIRTVPKIKSVYHRPDSTVSVKQVSSLMSRSSVVKSSTQLFHLLQLRRLRFQGLQLRQLRLLPRLRLQLRLQLRQLQR